MPQYPRPGSNAERILHFIISNEGTTTNKIITSLKMNPSVVRKCLAGLVATGKIEDRPDSDKNHHYHPKKVLV